MNTFTATIILNLLLLSTVGDAADCRSYRGTAICGTYIVNEALDTITFAGSGKYYNYNTDRTSTLLVSAGSVSGRCAVATITSTTTGGGAATTVLTGGFDSLQVNEYRGTWQGTGAIGGYPFKASGRMSNDKWYATDVETYSRSTYSASYAALATRCSGARPTTPTYFYGYARPNTEIGQAVGHYLTGYAQTDGTFSTSMATTYFGKLEIEGDYDDRDGTFECDGQGAGIEIRSNGYFGNGIIYTTEQEMRCSPRGIPYPTPDYRSTRYYFRVCGQMNRDFTRFKGDGRYKHRDITIDGTITKQPGGFKVRGTVVYRGRYYDLDTATIIIPSLSMVISPTVENDPTTVYGYIFENFFVFAGYFNTEFKT